MLRILILFCFVFNWINADTILIPKAFSADFLQKVKSPKNRVILYEGKVLMAQPSRLKWEYSKPDKKDVCSDGESVIVVDYALEQVSFYNMKKRFNLVEVLKSAKHYKGNIYVAKYGGRNYTLELDEKGRVDQIAYRDDMDNIVNIHFKKIKYLKKVPPIKALECKIPPTFDRIGE